MTPASTVATKTGIVNKRSLISLLEPVRLRRNLTSLALDHRKVDSAGGTEQATILSFKYRMATVGMDVVLSVPNRSQYHRQNRPPAVLFYFQLPNGAVPVVGEQHSSRRLVCSSPVPTNAPGNHYQGDFKPSGRVDLLQGDVPL